MEHWSVSRENPCLTTKHHSRFLLQEWFQTLPVITQYWFGATLLLTLAGNLGIVDPNYFPFRWQQVTDNFEVWRFLTCFCYAGAFEFPTLINLYLQVSFSKQYETGGPFNTGAGGGTADYAFMLALGALGCLVLKPLFRIVGVYTGTVYTRNLIFYVLYVWSKRHPTANVNIWGVPLKAIYLPFAYVVLSIFMGAPYMYMIHGILLGHFYFFLVDVVPTVYGKDILQTPQILIDQFGIGHYIPAGQPTPPPPQQDQQQQQQQRFGGGHSRGAGGQRLGGTAASTGRSTGTNSSRTPSSTGQSTGGGGGRYNWGGGGQRLGSD